MNNVTDFRPRPGGIVISNERVINKGALISIFDVEIPAWHLVIKDCKLFEKNGKHWIGMPSSTFTGGNGRTVYKNLVEFTDDSAKDRFQEALLDQLL